MWLVPLKIVFIASRFNAGAQLKLVFGGFKTRLKLIIFGHGSNSMQIKDHNKSVQKLGPLTLKNLLKNPKPKIKN